MTADTSANPSTDPTATRAALWNLIKDIRFAMFTTVHGNGHLHSRSMTTQNSHLDEDSSLWLFASRKGDPVADLVGSSTVNVSYADPGSDSYVSVSGTAQVVEDMTKKQQLWTKTAEGWFPDGVDDSDLALVQVKISHASYWNVQGSKISQLFHMSMALMTGKPPINLGTHGEITMR